MANVAFAGSTRWFAIHTKRRQEMRADANLRRWGIETFVPRLREWRTSDRGQISCRVTPLFPNYLFARFDPALLVGKVRLTRGVQSVVGFGQHATPIDDSVIEVIRSRIAEDGFVRPLPLQPGDPVEILDGPLRSLVGVFERRLDASERVLILLTAISQVRAQVTGEVIRRTTRPFA